MMSNSSDAKVAAAQRLLQTVATRLDGRFSVRLWEGTLVPMGRDVVPGLEISLSSPGVISSLLWKPTLENLLRLYACKHIDFHGADLLTVLDTVRYQRNKVKLASLLKWDVLRSLWPFVWTRAETATVGHQYAGDELGHARKAHENRDYIQFHYDLSNDFYALFLDRQMVYSCGYFTDWSNTLEQAQVDKLDMICRKLRLQAGERFLDIGSGWGALLCHAAEHYGVQAHGITLSQEQLAFTRERIARQGLTDRVTVELRDYKHLSGEWDKIASIGMVEHVGIANMSGYMATVAKLLPDRGMFLCHGITRPGKGSARKFQRMRPERRLLAKYIFPGGELDHLGHMVEAMEANKFEVHDVEGWRDHYALTSRLWCQRLSERREEAIRLVGEEKYRMWILYLAGVSMVLRDGNACIYQTVATKHASKGVSGLPPTRAHLYIPDEESAQEPILPMSPQRRAA